MGGHEMNEERRHFLRLGTRLLTFVTFPTGAVLRALTKDLGGGGACLLLEGLMDPGTPLELEMKFPDRELPLRCTAEVLWSKLSNEPTRGGYLSPPPLTETGVRFKGLSAKEQSFIIQYTMINAVPY